MADDAVALRVESSLVKLVSYLPERREVHLKDREITGICLDSRKINPGEIFIAYQGEHYDSHAFIADAVDRGAGAIVGSRDPEAYRHHHVPYFSVPEPKRAAAILSGAFFGFPSRDLTLIGVTGTDGKTTTTNLIHHILLEAGRKAGRISTVDVVIGEETLDTGLHVTTPESPDVQRYLAKMVNQGLTHGVIEATSHGLAQYRVDACAFDAAVFTNITHEHLDYHGSYTAYRDAKARLLTLTAGKGGDAHKKRGWAILNRDDAPYPYLSQRAESLGLRVISYGMEMEGEYRAELVDQGPTGSTLQVAGPGGRVRLKTALIGRYNAYNVLAALAVCQGVLDIKEAALRRGLLQMGGIPGRMERIEMGQPYTAMVDFAHTPNALRQALRTARSISSGRVIAVFGSAGLRDRAKRRMMAEVSAELADLTVLTAEDPRTESLAGILEEMAAGARDRGGVEGETFWRRPDRGNAIRFALEQAKEGDLVIVCGKGHEQSMCFGDTEYPWDDRVAMRAALAEQLGLDGPAMPYLPTQDS